MSAHFRRLKSSELIGVAAVLALLAALLYAVVLAPTAGAQRRSGTSRRALAERLLKRDPGRRLGGDTIVGVSDGDLLLGTPGRINFMMALGSGETIVGGNRNDQLGALGKNPTIRGGPGNDAIHGGPGHDTLDGGSGGDLITDTKGSATINTGSGKNEVEVAGHPGRDRVLCAPGSVDRIFANRGDFIAPSCRKAPGSQVVYHQPPPTTQPSAGNNGCNSSADPCLEKVASGSLAFLWSTDSLGKKYCPYFGFPPHPHPWLVNHWFHPPPHLSEARGILISAPRNGVDAYVKAVWGLNLQPFYYGNEGGSVTNWTFARQEWHMYFYCTRDTNLSYGPR